jgi:hypothetical protein
LNAALYEQCPQFDGCNANLCPLDTEWRRRIHERGEGVCLYLREFVKAGGEGRVREHLPPLLADAILAVAPEMTGRASPMSIQLQKAAAQGSKLMSGKRLRGERETANE